MKRNLRAGIAAAGTAVVTAGVLAATVGTAAASFSTPPWQPAQAAAPTGTADSSHEIGTLALFDSTGKQIISGTNLNHLFDYALASTADPGHGSLANLAFYAPAPSVDPLNWANSADESSPTPNTAGSTPSNLRNTSTPLVSLDSAGANLAAAKGGFPSQSASGYANAYEVRVYTTDASKYWAADIVVNGTSWSETYGTQVSTTTTVAGNPTSAPAGNSVTLTATVIELDGSTPSGTVTFKNGATTLGSSSTFNGSGQASISTTALPQGSDTITATFAPSDTTTYSGSSGTTTETITAPAVNTTTTLSISGNTLTGTNATLSGTVTAADSSVPAGTVSFYDNGSTTAINTSPVTVTSGAYSYTLTGGFSQGAHSVVAKFTPTSSAAYNPSQSTAQQFYTNQGAAAGSTCSQTGSSCTDTQAVEGTIPTGTLVISTPYTQNNPLNLGTLALNTAGTYWTGSATFQCIVVTDASSGGSPFVASAVANTLTQLSGTGNSAQHTGNAFNTINGENVGLTNLVPSTASSCAQTGTAPVNNYTATVTPTNNPAASPAVNPTDTGTAGLGNAPHTILTGSSGGEGTVTYDGKLTLNAPTNTAAGTYEGTVVFTVTD